MTRLRIVAPRRRIDLDKLTEAIWKTFGSDNWTQQVIRDSYITHNRYDWHASRVGWVGDAIATHYGVWDYQMRIGSARVGVAGVGAVLTRDEYRKRGYMDATARASLNACRELGYDMSILFGIPNFYHRFGYVPAWVESDYSTETKWWPAEPPARRAVKCAVVQHEDAIALYNRENDTMTGTAVRRRIGGASVNALFQSYRWSDESGGLQGYVLFEPHPPAINVEDWAGEPEQILRQLLKLARKLECTEIRFRAVPYLSPLARLLRRGDCREVRHYRSNSGAMITLLNLHTTLEKMCGELTSRLGASSLANWTGDLAIQSADERTTLHISDRRVSLGDPHAHTEHSITGGNGIARLLIGSDMPEEVCEQGGIALGGDAPELVRVLFPEQHPMLAAVDRF